MAGGAAGGGGVSVDGKPNVMTWIAITIAMMGAGMFGADQLNFSKAHIKPSFSQFWCPKFEFAKDLPVEYDGKLYGCDNLSQLTSEEQPPAWNNFNTLGGGVLVPAGMGVGALTLAPVMAGQLGRRSAISAGGILCFIGCLIVALSHAVSVYYVGRFLTGFGCGMTCMALPMYQSEVATSGIRGITGSLFQFMVVFGGCVAIMAATLLDSWAQGFMIPGYFGVLIGLLVWGVPESPRFLLSKGKTEAGRSALVKIRSGDVQEELDAIAETLRIEKDAGQVSYKDLFTKPGLRYRFFVAVYLPAAQQLTGVNAFTGFLNEFMIDAGLSQESIDAVPFGGAMLFQWCGLIAVTIGLLLVDSPYGGRKKQLNAASFLMGPFLLLAAAQKFFDLSPILGEVALYVYLIGFQAAWGIVPWFYPAELFKMAERERALSLATSFSFLVNFVVGWITPKMLGSVGSGATCLLFGLFNVSNILFVSLCMKETKGVASDDVPALFDGATKTAPLMAEA